MVSTKKRANSRLHSKIPADKKVLFVLSCCWKYDIEKVPENDHKGRFLISKKIFAKTDVIFITFKENSAASHSIVFALTWKVCVSVKEGKRECVFVCTCERWRERERERVCVFMSVKEVERGCVWVCKFVFCIYKYSVRRLIGSRIIESAAYCNQILPIPYIPKYYIKTVG